MNKIIPIAAYHVKPYQVELLDYMARNKVMSMSPWLNKEQTSCELEYNSEQDGVAGVTV